MSKQEIAEVLRRVRAGGKTSPNHGLRGEPLPPSYTGLPRYFVSQLDWQKCLGRGACGVVAAATFKVNGFPAAVKLSLFATPDESTLLEREAAFLASVPRSAHIPEIYGLVAFDDAPGRIVGFAMELTGGSLDSFVADWRENGDGPSRVALARGFIGSARAVANAHGAGVLHGDIKPANFLGMPARPEFMVGDWGFAQYVEPGSVPAAVPGSVAYWAPEVRASKLPSVKGDVWAFGMSIFAVCYDVAEQTLREAVARNSAPPAIPACCPPGLRELLLQCRDLEPTRRPTMEEVAARLAALTEAA